MSITLRVYVVDTDATKVIKFDPRITVQDALTITQEKANVPVSIYGFYLKAEDGTGKWLKEEKTLLFYDLKSNDMVEFRRKQRPLKIKLLDESIKTVIVDESQPVVDVVRQIAKKIGLGNPDEFSLIEDKKEADWLKPTTSLHEQGIPAESVLLMKKKFFFSDANIDASDPLELHLLYVQATKQILQEELRCSMEEAIKLAGLQLQVTYGNHNPNKHKLGAIKIEEILPMTFRKARNIDKEIFAEHRKLSGVSDVHAKYRYVQTCRQIKTYGITFFNIKEKTKKDKKIMNRLLGVTRDSIIRLDGETRTVISHYPLTHLRRWAANPGTFTMDFGDYEDEYVVVQTSEGDAISQLIAGYIDIILQKRREGNAPVRHLQEEEMIATEEVVGAVRAQAITTMSGALSSQQQASGTGGPLSPRQGGFAQMASLGSVSTEGTVAQCATILSEIDVIYQEVSTKSAVLTDYNATESMMQSAMNSITASIAEVHGKKVEIPQVKLVEPEEAPLELARAGESLASETALLVCTKDPSQAILSTRSILASCGTMMSAARAACVLQGAGGSTNHKLIEAVQLMATASAQLAAAHGRNDQAGRVAAAKSIAAATSMMISAGEIKQATLVQQGASIAVISPAAKHSQAVVGAAKTVSDCCARLLASSKTTAQTSDPVLAEKVVIAAKAASIALLELSNQAKIAADRVTLAVYDPAVEAGLIAAAKNLGSSIAVLVGATHAAAAATGGRIDPAQQQLIAFATKAVADSIAGFVSTSKNAMMSIPTHIVREELQGALKDIDEATNGLMTSIISQTSQTATLASVNSVATSSAKLVSAARSAAIRTTDESKRAHLQRTAERVNDLISSVITFGQDVHSLQENEQSQEKMKEIIKEVTELGSVLLEVQLKEDLVESSTKFESSIGGLQTFAQEALVLAPPIVQQSFSASLRTANEAIAALHAARLKTSEPQSVYTASLVNSARAASVAISSLIENARSIMTTCNNPVVAQKLATLIAAANESTSKLISTYRAAGSDQKDIDELILQTDAVAASMTQLLNSVEGDETSLMEAAKKLALSANEMVILVNEKVSSITNPELAEHLTLAAKSIASATSQLVPAAKSVLKNGIDHDSRIKLSSAASAVCSSVKNLVSAAQSTFSQATPSRNVMTSHNAVVAAAELCSTVPLAKVEEELVPDDPVASALAEGAALVAAGYTDEMPVGGRGHSASVSKSLAVATTSVANASGNLASATSRVLISLNESPEKVDHAIEELSTSTRRVVQAATSQIDKIKSEALRNQLKMAAKAVSKATSNLVIKAKSQATDNFAKQQVAAACKDVATFTQNVMTTTKIASAIAPLEESLQSILSPCPPWKLKINETSVELLPAIDKVVQAGNQVDLVTSAKALAARSSGLTTAAKEGATTIQDPILQQQLLDAAKSVNDGTTQLISAARARLTNPDAVAAVERAGRVLKAATTSVVQTAEFASVNSHSDTIVATAKPVVAHIVDLISKISNKDDMLPVVKSLSIVTSKFAAALRSLAAITPEEYVQGELFDIAQDINDTAWDALNVSRSAASEQEIFQKVMTSANNLVTLTQKSINSGRTACSLVPKTETIGDSVEQEIVNSIKALEALNTRIHTLKPFPEAGVSRKIYEVSDSMLESTRVVYASCTRLLLIARAIQREIVDARIANPGNATYQPNAQGDEAYSTGIKNIIACFSQLIEATSEFAQGHGKESKVILTSQSIATATTQFISSSKYGGHETSRNYERLQSAARYITQSTGLLVRTAQQCVEQTSGGSFRNSEYLTTSFAETQKREMETKRRLLKLERQLADARVGNSN